MPLKTLIVDDSELIGKKLKELISQNTCVYLMGQAKSIAEAFKMIPELKPDLIFLDINLPDGSGMQVLKYLKRIAKEIKVIIFSNSANDFYKRKFTENGCDYFLDKSKDFTQIPTILASMVAA